MEDISLTSTTIEFVDAIGSKDSWPTEYRLKMVEALHGLGIFNVDTLSEFQPDMDRVNLNGIPLITARKMVKYFSSVKQDSLRAGLAEDKKENEVGKVHVSNLY